MKKTVWGVLASFALLLLVSCGMAFGQMMVQSLPASAYAQVDVAADSEESPALPALEPAAEPATEPGLSDEDVGAIVEALGAAVEIGSYAVDKWGDMSNMARFAIGLLLLWVFAPWIVRITPTKWDDNLLAYEGVLGGVRAFLWRVVTLRPAKKPESSSNLS